MAGGPDMGIKKAGPNGSCLNILYFSGLNNWIHVMLFGSQVALCIKCSHTA